MASKDAIAEAILDRVDQLRSESRRESGGWTGAARRTAYVGRGGLPVTGRRQALERAILAPAFTFRCIEKWAWPTFFTPEPGMADLQQDIQAAAVRARFGARPGRRRATGHRIPAPLHRPPRRGRPGALRTGHQAPQPPPASTTRSRSPRPGPSTAAPAPLPRPRSRFSEQRDRRRSQSARAGEGNLRRQADGRPRGRPALGLQEDPRRRQIRPGRPRPRDRRLPRLRTDPAAGAGGEAARRGRRAAGGARGRSRDRRNARARGPGAGPGDDRSLRETRSRPATSPPKTSAGSPPRPPSR